MNGPKLGRPIADKILYKIQCLQEKADAEKRNALEGKFGEGKRKYYLQRTMTRLKETTETQIHLTFLVMNLTKGLRVFLCAFLKITEKYLLLDRFSKSNLLKIA